MAAALLLLWLLWRYVPRYRAWIAARRRAREEAEPAYFARAERACRAGDAMAAYRALGDWARRVGAVSVTAWCDQEGTPELRAQFDALERALFSRDDSVGAWQGIRLAAAFGGARKAWLDGRQRVRARPRALPALNPTAEPARQ